ncbi:carbohydrate kinase family protein [Thermococcus waiotapuensis]|uniref:Sugar kinase n=1 Tax=Thermococcus waiotapuensis TaxID=90909 RepID=A0AAE4NWM9_9EURY|nr:sugar kinase [Thermococcus waiotapuensis]MDV3104554.1 sugar kinase [Thermococcus waiotapuensis]
MLDVLSIGEILVDLKIINGKISMHTGGSCLNVSFYSWQAGAKSSFIGTIGDDFLGTYIKKELEELDFRPALSVVDRNTTLVLIKAERETPIPIIYRGADMFITKEQLDEKWKDARIVHTSAFALSLSPAKETILEALKSAKENGALISVDPNYRRWIWKKWEADEKALLEAISLADLVKPSLDDARELLGRKDPIDVLWGFKNLGAKNVILSMGSKGVIALTEEGRYIRVPAEKAELVDPTGAGDSLLGTVLAKLSQGYDMEEAIRSGVKVASKVVSAEGTLVKVR